MKELELLEVILNEKGIELTPNQVIEFKKGCKKAIDDHLDADCQKKAAEVYLYLVLKRPDMNL